MLALPIHTAAPLIRDKTRLLALTSNSMFGRTDYHDQWLMEHLNNFVENLGNQGAADYHQQIRNREMPELSRHRKLDENWAPSDVLLKETYRQHRGISERYRAKLPNIHDLQRIAEPSTRLHISMSRGVERELVDLFTHLESEAIDRQTVKPIV